jgi:dTDP-4-dehydrorhamnose 3,5-epimerase
MMDTRWTKPIILTVPAFEDFRGYLAVPYDQSINFNVRQINQGYSKKTFTLRGLHFQEGEHAQAKLVSCLHGSIFNVAVDLRPGETFGHAYSAVLSFENRKQMYIPRGFAHGYLTLEDDTLMQWCVDNDFCGEVAKAVRYDSDFVWEGESWPEGAYIISEKDRNAVRLENFCGR